MHIFDNRKIGIIISFLGLQAIIVMAVMNLLQPGSDKKTTTNSTQESIPKVVNGQIVRGFIPAGASGQGNPSFTPAIINTKKGYAIEWTNNDNVPHTVTSAKDNGKSFDSSIIMSKKKFVLDTSTLKDSEYNYFFMIHPFMKGKLVLK